MRRLYPTSACIVIVTVALLMTACPASSDLDRAAKGSNELAHDVLLANRAIVEIYKAGRMSLAAKDKILDKLAVLGDKGEKFNNILIDLDKKYPQGTLPPQDLAFVRDNLGELRRLYTEIVADLLPLGAQRTMSTFDKDLTAIEKVIK